MDPNGPFGAKEASEGPLSGFLSALAAAVEDAVVLAAAVCVAAAFGPAQWMIASRIVR